MNKSHQLVASCRKLAAKYSWSEVVDKMITEIANTAGACRDRAVSMAELHIIAGGLLKGGLMIVRELQEGNYYGYRVGPNIYRKQMDRLESAFRELSEVFRVREADQSPHAKIREAQLSARHVCETGLAELTDFPRLSRHAKDDSGERLKDYMIDDLHLAKYASPARLRLKPPPHKTHQEETDQHEAHQYDTRPGFIEMVETLARDGKNLFEHPNPAARIKIALARQAKRECRKLDQRSGQSPEQADGEDTNDFFDLQQSTWLEGLRQDKDTARNAPRTQNDDTIVDMDLEQALKRAGLSPDQIRVVKAISHRLDPGSAKAHRVLGMKPLHYARVLRSLKSDRKAGASLGSLRKHFAAYNPSIDAK
jgi:hypothetical protein